MHRSPPYLPLPYLGLVILAAALGVRLGYWGLVVKDPSQAIYEFHLVQGKPYADAFYWDRLAARLAAGEGISGTGWEARRPFYAYFLAVIYAWTGPRYGVAQAFNVALSVFTVWLLYDLTRRLAGQAAGFVVGLWGAWHPTAVCLSLITLTETLGWLFIVWHVQQSICAVAAPRKHAWRSGLLFAASNLTRTLTLFVLPGVVVALVVLCRRAGATWTEARRAGAACALGAVTLLLPFMFLQWWNFGVFTLSSNSAGDLYAASSPQFGRWSFEVEKVADAAGAKTIKERYTFFMQEAKKNLREHPQFFLNNVRRTTLRAWQEMQTLDVPGGWLTLLAGLVFAHACFGLPTAGQGGAGQLAAAEQFTAPLTAALVGLAALAEARWPGAAPQVLAAVALLRALFFVHGEGLWLAVNYVAFTLLAVGLFAAIEPRLVMFIQWSLIVLVAVGVATLWQTALRLLGSNTALAAQPPLRVVIGRPRWGWRLAALALLLAPLLLHNAVGAAMSDLAAPTPEQTSQLVDFAAAQRPAFFSPAEQAALGQPRPTPTPSASDGDPALPPSLAAVMAAGSPESTDGKLIVLRGKFDRHVYRFDANRGGNHQAKTFARRNYGRNIVHFEGHDLHGVNYFLKVVLPQPWSPPRNQTWLLLARGNPELREYTNPTLEAIALAPVPAGAGPLLAEEIQYCDTLEHVQLIQVLAAPVHAP